MSHSLVQRQEEIGMNDEVLNSLVWLEVSHGRQLVQELEQKLNVAPPGSLSMHGCCDKGMTRADLICDAAAIVSTFSNLITLLNSIPAGLKPEAVVKNTDHECGEVELQQTANSPACNSSSPISLIRTSTSPPSGTCSPSPQPTKQVKEIMQPSSYIFCTKTPPQSPRSTTSTTSAKRSIDQTRSLDSCHATGIQKFDPTAYQEASLDVEENFNLPENSMEALSNEKKESGIKPQTSLSKKRKYMPKRTFKLPASNTEQGNEAPAPMDGWAWRKYGQKDILGSHHPRSYYRCTRKTQLGCPAIKYVQKSDDDPPVFHVTYKGEHICQAKKSFRPQLYPHSTLPMTSFQDSKSNFHKNSSCLTLSSNGYLQMGQSRPIFPTTKDFQLPMLKNSTEKTLGNDVIYRPLPRFSVPELARTLKLETDGDFNYVHPNPKNLTGIIDLGADDKSMFMNGFHLPNQTISQAQISQINESRKPNLGDFGTTEADQSTHKYSRSNSANLGRDTSQAFKQILKQLLDPLFLDEKEAYESSADPNMFELSGELFSASNSEFEVASNSAPLESLPRYFHDSKSELSLTAIAAKGQPPSSDQSEISEVVAENIPNFKFDLDFMLTCPDSQPMKELQSLLFD